MKRSIRKSRLEIYCHKQVGFFLHQNRFKSPLKNVTHPSMLSIDILRIRAIEQFHAIRRACPICFNQQMIVIVHKAASGSRHGKPNHSDRKQFLTVIKTVVDHRRHHKYLRALPRAVTWYSAPANSIRKGLAIAIAPLFPVTLSF
jgi:hypothetical protein